MKHCVYCSFAEEKSREKKNNLAKGKRSQKNPLEVMGLDQPTGW